MRAGEGPLGGGLAARAAHRATADVTQRRPIARFGVLDVHYPTGGGGWAALVVAGDERFATVVAEHVAFVPDVAPYHPGAFFARELPPVRAVISQVDHCGLFIVDGYVDLDPRGRPGLGAYLHAETGVPVVGVAKTLFRDATHAIPVHRGAAERPLYVTSAGLPVARAAAMVAGMAGRYRLPDALRRADSLARWAARTR